MVVLRFYQGRGGEITPAAGQATAGIPEPEYLLQYRILAGFRNVQFLTDVPSRLYCRFAFFLLILILGSPDGTTSWYKRPNRLVFASKPRSACTLVWALTHNRPVHVLTTWTSPGVHTCLSNSSIDWLSVEIGTRVGLVSLCCRNSHVFSESILCCFHCVPRRSLVISAFSADRSYGSYPAICRSVLMFSSFYTQFGACIESKILLANDRGTDREVV